MNYTFLFINNAEERFETLYPLHIGALKSIIDNLSHWDSDAFFRALDGLSWREKRLPLTVIEAERADWEKQYSMLPYNNPKYRFFSYEWKQELLSYVFPKKARYSFAFKKGMCLIDAVGNVNHALRALYTDLPILYKLDKMGSGILVVSEDDKDYIQQKLTENSPKTDIPILIIVINH